MRLLPAALVAFTLTATQAFAQEAPSSPLQSAQALIDRFQVGDLFVPVEGESVTVRHLASGLVCHFFGTPTRTDLLVFSADNAPRGSDVGCLTNVDGKIITLYATHYDPPLSLDEALRGGIAGIEHSFPGAQPTPATMTISTEGAPTPRVAHFLATRNGQRWFASVAVAEFNGWIFKIRYSAPAPEETPLTSHELEAGSLFTLALLDLLPPR